VAYSAGDVLFTAGEVPNEPKMYILTSGSLEYHRDMSSQTVSSGWFAEAVLWCVWVHRGVMRATLDCRLLTIDATTFQELGNQFQHSNISIHPGLYAAEFQDRMRQDRELCSDLIDPNLTQVLVNSLADIPDDRDKRRSTMRGSIGSRRSRASVSVHSTGRRSTTRQSVVPSGDMTGFEPTASGARPSVDKKFSIKSGASQESLHSMVSRSGFELMGSIKSRLSSANMNLTRLSVH